MHLTKQNKGLDALHFDNRFIQTLPADLESENFRREVTEAVYSYVTPKKMPKPILVAYSREMAETLGLRREDCESEAFTEIFSGNQLLPGMNPYATCYGGHQFGHWAGQLGDGRAINLGEILNKKNERWALQLKGAGPTPYSRTADGLAVLRSSIREFLCSEAMFHLGIPTTRALSLITTGETVLRDMFYDGHPKQEPGAVVCRVAPSFTRFGHFQILSARRDIALLKQLMDYTLRTDFPHLEPPSKKSYLAWFREVCTLTTTMVVHWMRVGFVHGVMNTDNMSILGLTIDYGPYGWLENYDANWTPNTTDAQGRRYRFSHQAQIAQWNLLQLAYAIYPLIEEKEALEAILNHFSDDYETKWQSMMAQKLGLQKFEAQTDEPLISELLTILQLTETDMTLFYRNLANLDVRCDTSNKISNETLIAPLSESYYTPEKITDAQKAQIGNWIRQYLRRLKTDGLDNATRRKKMNAVNPKYVFRNYLAQLAIDKAEAGDYAMVSELLDVLRQPYDTQPMQEDYAKKRPDWARTRAGCSMLSCSS